MDKISPPEIEFLTEHIKVLEGCLDPLNNPTWEIQIYGHPSIGMNPDIGQYYCGEPLFTVLRESAFDYSQMINGDPNPNPGFLTGEYDRAWIVIYDHSSMINGEFRFNGNDLAYRLPYSVLADWLTLECHPEDMCLVVMGEKSGRALSPLADGSRLTISSMTDTENVLDHFNMARRLDCSFNWRSAFQAEKDYLQGYQTPQILPV
jgi:hypothetical protein